MRKLKDFVSDKAKFIFYNIIAGIIFWIILSVLIAYQQYIMKTVSNLLLNFLLYMFPYLASVWFITESRRKFQWKPFGEQSEILGIIIIVAEVLVLSVTIGVLKVFI